MNLEKGSGKIIKNKSIEEIATNPANYLDLIDLVH